MSSEMPLIISIATLTIYTKCETHTFYTLVCSHPHVLTVMPFFPSDMGCSLYCALDYSHISKHRNLNVSSSLNDVATWSVNQTGFFCSYPQWKIVEGGRIEPFDEECCRGAEYLSKRLGVPFFPMEQLGILRTNCIE